jgi:hypothetical protein
MIFANGMVTTMEQSDSKSLRLWDFLSPPPRCENLILRWVHDEKLTKQDRAKLNQRLDRLCQLDFRLAVGTKLLAGPIYEHIYKLVIHGNVMLRPMLCRGPIAPTSEYTLLLGAIERNGKLPKNALKDAAQNRLAVLKDPTRRGPHEPIPHYP